MRTDEVPWPQVEALAKKMMEGEAEFEPCTMTNDMGDTEMILKDCLMVWDRWDDKTEIAKDESGLLVGVRLIGFAK